MVWHETPSRMDAARTLIQRSAPISGAAFIFGFLMQDKGFNANDDRLRNDSTVPARSAGNAWNRFVFSPS
jgi:hypothetical protein